MRSATATAWRPLSTTTRRCPACAPVRCSSSSTSPLKAWPISRCPPTTRACRFPMSRRPSARLAPAGARGLSVGLIALLVALVATIQIRSQAEVERSLVGVDATSLAFLIDDLHRANESLEVEKADLARRRATLQSGQTGAADQVLRDEAERLRAIEGLVRVQGPGVVMVIDASGLTALDLQDALNNLSAAGAEAIDVNDHRVVTGVPVAQTTNGVAVDGNVIMSPWTISAIGDPNRLALVADLMTQQLRADRRVRGASYRVETDVVISSLISEKPFVYALPG